MAGVAGNVIALVYVALAALPFYSDVVASVHRIQCTVGPPPPGTAVAETAALRPQPGARDGQP
jgi:hypothetical protein